jgi:ABC-type glycerol-3-phosphate transport system substrate-binding protein
MFKARLLLIIVMLLLINGPVLAQDRVLEIWSHEFAPLEEAIIEKWIPEFEAANPGVRVEYTVIPFAGTISYDTKLLTDLVSGGGPDVMDIGSWQYNQFIDAGLLAPLDPTIFGYDSADDLINDYPAGSMGTFVRNGQVYAMFSELNTLALFYNLDMFEAAGIDPLPEDRPVSWERIGEIGAQLRQVDDNNILSQIGYQFGFFAAFRSPQWYAQNYYALMRQYGQNDLFVDGEPAADTEAAINAFQVIYDFTYEYEAYDPNFLVNWFADFPNNRVAMVLAGAWFAPAIRGQNPEVRFGVAPHPVVDPDDESTYKNIAWTWSWSVNANKSAEQQELAQEFLAFMLGKKGEAEQPLYWFEQAGYLQPRSAFLESDEYQSVLEADPWLNQFFVAYDMFDIDYVQHSYDDIGSALVRAIDRVIYDGMSAEETAALLQAELQRMQ